MKIGIFDPYLDTLSGGEKYILTAAVCLLSSQNEVFLFWDPKEEAKLKQAIYKKLGLDISLIKFTPNIFSSDIPFFSRIKSSKKYDIIIYLSDGSIPLVWPKLYVHFQFPVEWVKGDSVITKFKLKRVSGILCNSLFTKNYIDRKFGVKSTILYPPVSKNNTIEDKSDLANTNKENVILNVGRFGVDIEGSNYKKQDIMIKVFKKMVDRGLAGWKFILITGVRQGDKDKLWQLKKIAKGYPITFIENPSNSFLWEQYRKAKIYWHASGFGEDLKKHPEKAEHFGISTVEAMMEGAVPVVINAGGQKEIVEDGKNGFLWDKEIELIEKTDILIKNPEVWIKMSKEAIRRSKVFNVERFCEELTTIIKSR